jgi:hypothetical protein
MSTMMEQLLREEHLAVREAARKFALEVVLPGSAARDENEEFPADLVRQMADLGFLGLPYGEEWGGAGLDTLAYCIAVEEIARVDASLAITLAAHTSLGCGPIAAFGTEAQKKKFLVPMAQGKLLGAFGLTEPNAGSDAGGTETTAVRDDGGWRVNGTKIYITNGSVAGVVVFTAKTDRTKGTRGITSFIVETTAPGFKVGKHEVLAGRTIGARRENPPVGCRLASPRGRGARAAEPAVVGRPRRGASCPGGPGGHLRDRSPRRRHQPGRMGPGRRPRPRRRRPGCHPRHERPPVAPPGPVAGPRFRRRTAPRPGRR